MVGGNLEIPAYVIGDCIGSGGFGEVYRARHTLMERDVAIKILHPQCSDDREAVARFIAEARAVARISHPNVVEVFDFGQLADGRYYCVMELIRGKTLRDLLRDRGWLPLGEAVPILRGIAEAVDVVHAAGIAHRDLKPDNVFLLDDGRIKLIDFGLAKLKPNGTPTLTESGQIFGTPLYMSPEQFRGKAIDVRTDQYSFGSLAYHLLTGQPPFTGDTLALALHHLNDVPDPPSARRHELSERVDSSVLALLEKDPAHRPATLVGAIDALTDVSIPITRRRTRLTRWLIAGAAVAGIGTIAALMIHDDQRAATAVTTLRLDVMASNLGQQDAAWLAPVIARSARDRLRTTPERTFWLDPTATARIELGYRLEHDLVHIEARGPDGAVLGSTDAHSVAEVLDQLLPIVVRKLDNAEGRVIADPSEHHQISQLGARSAALLRRYLAAVETYSRTVAIDPEPIAAELERVIAADPTWAHPYAALVLVYGGNSAKGRAVRARGLRLADRARDPTGARVLDAFELSDHAAVPAAIEALESMFAATPEDLIVGPLLFQLLVAVGRPDDVVAVLRRLLELRPDLQFGADVAITLEWTGRAAEAATTIRSWAAAAPESAQGAIELMRLEATAGHADEVERLVGRLVLVHGDRPELRVGICDAYLTVGRLEQAHHIADKMLLASPLIRAHGRYRLGEIAVLEGRFAAAFDTLEKAIDEYRPFGQEGSLMQVLVLQRAIASVAGRPDDLRAKTLALADKFAHHGSTGQVALYRFAATQLDRGSSCPSPDPFLVSVADPQARSTARRGMLRVAARAGCETCKNVVAAGLSAEEPSTESLLAFGECAIQEHQFALARQSLTRAARWTPDNQYSAYHSVLALYQLARLAMVEGNRDEARKHYNAFLARWQNADRPIPEVAEALEAVRTLEPH